MMNKDNSANLYQKCLISCRTILLDVLHSMSLSTFLPWQHSGFQISLILRALLATIGVLFMFLYLYIYMYKRMFVSALPDPTCNSEKSANGGNEQILLLLLLLLLLF